MINKFDSEIFLPGIIQRIQSSPDYKFYFVLNYDGLTHVIKGSDIVKLSKSQYTNFVELIYTKKLFFPREEPPKKSLKNSYIQSDPIEKENQFSQTSESIFHYLTLDNQYSLKIIKKKLEEIERNLPELSKGEKVLAKCIDDGWYYWSHVEDKIDNLNYLVRNSLDTVDKVRRIDLVTYDNQFKLNEKDCLIAPHPNYYYSYAPAILLSLNSDPDTALIKFYDGLKCHTKVEDIFKIGLCKFEYDVAYILNREKNWVKKKVIAFNHEERNFEEGVVRGRVSGGKKFIIEKKDSKLFICQDIVHLFGNQSTNNIVTKYVLVRIDRDKWLIGKSDDTQSNPLKIELIDGNFIEININEINAYFLAKRYYKFISNFLKP